MIEVEVFDLQAATTGLPSVAEVRRLCLLAAASAGVRDGHLAIEFVDGERIAELNARYRGEPSTTDVLSFPSGEKEPGAHLGDIVVSWPAVARQAREFGHPEESEVALLAVHGFLHILGWDHATVPEESEMNRLTLDALARSGIAIASGRLLNPTTRG